VFEDYFLPDERDQKWIIFLSGDAAIKSVVLKF